MADARQARRVIGAVGVLLLVAGCGDEQQEPTERGGPAATDEQPSEPETQTSEPAPRTSEPETDTSEQVTDPPEDWEDRPVDGPGSEEAQRLLDELVATLGPHRAGSYAADDVFEVRVVEPTDADHAAVDAASAASPLPFTVLAVPVSYAWLDATALHVDGAMPPGTVTVGVDLEAMRLQVTITAGVADPEGLRTQVVGLVQGRLDEGRPTGEVAADVAPDDVLDTEGRGPATTVPTPGS